jgi:hypothetical protein
LFIVYELKDIFYFENVLLNSHQIFRRGDKIYELENFVFLNLRKLLRIWGQREKEIEIWKNLLNQIEGKYNKEFLENILKYDITIWIRSKIENRPVINLLNEQAIKEYPEIFNIKIENIINTFEKKYSKI